MTHSTSAFLSASKRSFLILTLFALGLFTSWVSFGQTAYLDSLKVELSAEPSDSLKAIILSDLCWNFRSVSLDSAALYGQQAIQFCIESGNDKELATAYNNYAIVWWSKGNYDSAKVYLQKASDQFQKNNFPKGRVVTLINLGLINQNLGDFESSLNNLLVALDLQVASGDSSRIPTTLGNIGNVYNYLEEWSKAKDYYLLAVNLAQKLEANPYLAFKAQNLGMAYRTLHQLDSAEYYLKIAETHALAKKDYEILSKIYLNLANVYLDSEDEKEFLQTSLRSKKYFELRNNPFELSQIYNNIARGYSLFNRSDSALFYSNKALNLAEESKNNERLMQTFKIRKEVMASLNRLNEAYAASLKYDIYKDSVLSAEKQKGIDELQTKYETAQKEQEIANQKLEITSKESSIKSQRFQIYGLLSGLLIVLLAGFIFYNQYKNKQQQKLQAAILQEKERGFETVLTATEEERSRISKELHDGIGQQLSALKLGLQSVSKSIGDESQRKQLEEIATSFSKSAEEVRHISHQMMPRALMEKGLVEAIEDLLQSSFQYTDTTYSFEHHNITGRFEERIEVSIYRVIQELINNIIKHAGAQTVTVQLIKQKGNLLLFLEDNGKGMNEESTKGHGLLNIKSRLDMINGTVDWSAGSEKGTFVTVKIALSNTST
ncbi:MAG: tetratricopeptide repeat protein [Cyclobacteriaceae bacterium]